MQATTVVWVDYINYDLIYRKKQAVGFKTQQSDTDIQVLLPIVRVMPEPYGKCVHILEVI